MVAIPGWRDDDHQHGLTFIGDVMGCPPSVRRRKSLSSAPGGRDRRWPRRRPLDLARRRRLGMRCLRRSALPPLVIDWRSQGLPWRRRCVRLGVVRSKGTLPLDPASLLCAHFRFCHGFNKSGELVECAEFVVCRDVETHRNKSLRPATEIAPRRRYPMRPAVAPNSQRSRADSQSFHARPPGRRGGRSADAERSFSNIEINTLAAAGC